MSTIFKIFLRVKKDFIVERDALSLDSNNIPSLKKDTVIIGINTILISNNRIINKNESKSLISCQKILYIPKLNIHTLITENISYRNINENIDL